MPQKWWWMIVGLLWLSVTGNAQSEGINTGQWDHLYRGEIVDTTPITYTFAIESDAILVLWVDVEGEVFVEAALEENLEMSALLTGGFLSDTAFFYQGVFAETTLRLTIDPSIGTIIPGTRYEIQASLIPDVSALPPVPTNARLDLTGDTPYQLFQLDAKMGETFTHTIGDTAGVAYFNDTSETLIVQWPDFIDQEAQFDHLMIRHDDPGVIAVFRYEPTIADLTTAIHPPAQPDMMFYVRLTPQNPMITIPLQFHGEYRLLVQATGPFTAEINEDEDVTLAKMSGIGSWYLTPFQLAQTALADYRLVLSAGEFAQSGDEPSLDLYVMLMSSETAE
ncbi:MAG: hypothetical protein MUF87_01665 [Anaerolineae bacterium]|jgi:hypothetical protein|nr:hypothetical protein [Anaerolineae bacterium]